MERTEWNDVRQKHSNEIEAPDIPYETWPMSVKDAKRMTTTEMRMV